MAISTHTLDLLHDKFISGKISRGEKELLYSEYKSLYTDKNGKVDFDMLDEFLVTSHRSYGKSVKGIVSIV